MWQQTGRSEILSVEVGVEHAPVILEVLVWFKHPILVLWELHLHTYFPLAFPRKSLGPAALLAEGQLWCNLSNVN